MASVMFFMKARSVPERSTLRVSPGLTPNIRLAKLVTVFVHGIFMASVIFVMKTRSLPEYSSGVS
jgi:hypothetical protein